MHDYQGYYPPPPPQRQPRRRHWAIWTYLGLVALVIIGVAVYVLMERLSDEVLAVIATVGCAAGVSLPALLLALVVLLRREENGRKAVQQQPQVMPPIVLPPTVIQPQQLPTQQPPPATWEEAPAPRRFTVVGEE